MEDIRFFLHFELFGSIQLPKKCAVAFKMPLTSRIAAQVCPRQDGLGTLKWSYISFIRHGGPFPSEPKTGV